VGAASDYLRSLGKTHLDSGELAHFVQQLSAEPDKEGRQAAIDHLLRIAQLTAEQVLAIASCEPVRNAVGLQHSIVRYARARQFEAARESATEVPAWQFALAVLTGWAP
jgi:hypothetical protein